jgi:RNA polymerase sigma factor (sigma-70 family)
VRIQPATFHDLYSRYASDVYRFSLWLTGNSEDAQDITSETFVRVWTEEPRTESVKAYLFVIARNLHRRQWRRQSRYVVFDQEKHETPDPSASPAESSVNNESVEQALEAMRLLPEQDRELLLLRADAELSYEDIAVTTGLPAATIRVRVFRARAKLAALLKPKSLEKI